jgi:hypothetical protein
VIRVCRQRFAFAAFSGFTVAMVMGCAARAAAQAITVTGASPPLAITSAVAGQPLIPASGSGGRYSVVVTAANQKIIAQLDRAMPPGTTLSVTVVAPSGARSEGRVTLDTSPQAVVTGLQVGSYDNLTITYRLDAAVSAGPVSRTARTISFLVVAGP